MDSPREVRRFSPGADGSVNAYTREVARRAAAREGGVDLLDAELVHGLHRNAAESAFASLMLAPGQYHPAASAGAKSVESRGDADVRAGDVPKRRRWVVIALVVALVIAASQAVIVAGWWWVFHRAR